MEMDKMKLVHLNLKDLSITMLIKLDLQNNTLGMQIMQFFIKEMFK